MISLIRHDGKGGIIGAENRSVVQESGAWEGNDYLKASARGFGGEGTPLYRHCGCGHMALCVLLTALPSQPLH